VNEAAMTVNTELAESGRRRFEADLRAQLHAVYSARPWIAAGEIVQAAAGMAEQLRAAGAERALAVGAYPGIGVTDESVEHIAVGQAVGGSLMDGVRFANATLHDPPMEVLAAVNRFDPTGSARSVVDFLISAGMVCGRETFGARPSSWEALEDKIAAPDLWRAAGIGSAPTACVDLDDRGAVIDAHRRLASDEGTVWAVDNRAGWHGGAHGTYLVPDARHAETVLDRLDARHRQVRVMPYLEGTPCSIHGMVVGDGIVVFRPIESLVYRTRAEPRLVYAKAASFWDPPDGRRIEMRTAAVRVGTELRRRIDYRGVFTLDGILTSSGFCPTEVNTRFGGALPLLIETSEGTPINLFLTHLGVIEGVLDINPSMLERWVCADLDARRFCVAFFETSEAPDEERSIRVLREPSGELAVSEPADDVGESLATITWGTKGDAGMLRIVGGSALPKGPSTAPLVLSFARLAAAHWNAGLPDLETP